MTDDTTTTTGQIPDEQDPALILAQWLEAQKAKEQEAAENAEDVSRCESLDDAGIGDGVWSRETGIAFARVMIRPGDGDATPAKALATLSAVCYVPNRDKALEALQFERSRMRRTIAIDEAFADRYAGFETRRQERADAAREGRRQYRTINNLTQAPKGA